MLSRCEKIVDSWFADVMNYRPSVSCVLRDFPDMKSVEKACRYLSLEMKSDLIKKQLSLNILEWCSTCFEIVGIF